MEFGEAETLKKIVLDKAHHTKPIFCRVCGKPLKVGEPVYVVYGAKTKYECENCNSTAIFCYPLKLWDGASADGK